MDYVAGTKLNFDFDERENNTLGFYAKGSKVVCPNNRVLAVARLDAYLPDERIWTGAVKAYHAGKQYFVTGTIKQDVTPDGTMYRFEPDPEGKNASIVSADPIEVCNECHRPL